MLIRDALWHRKRGWSPRRLWRRRIDAPSPPKGKSQNWNGRLKSRSHRHGHRRQGGLRRKRPRLQVIPFSIVLCRDYVTMKLLNHGSTMKCAFVVCLWMFCTIPLGKNAQMVALAIVWALWRMHGPREPHNTARIVVIIVYVTCLLFIKATILARFDPTQIYSM